jgi:predicted DNA binding CopG/RHH family protein
MNKKYKFQFDPEEVKKWELDDEDKEILHSLENDEWVELEGKELEEQKKIAKNAAANTLAEIRKNKQITLRINNTDLEKIKLEAQKEGLPYQTLIGSILHKFVAK